MKILFEPAVVSLIARGAMGDRIAALGIPVYTIGMKPGKPTPATTRKLIHTVRQLKPDLIQGWKYHGNLAAQLASVFYLPNERTCFIGYSKLKIQYSIYQA